MARLQMKLTPSAPMQLSRKLLLFAGIGLLVLVGLLALVKQAMPSPSQLFARKEPEPVRKVEMPDNIKPAAQPYAELKPKPQPPVAQPVVREVVAATPPPPRDERPVVAQTTPQPPLPSFLEMWKEQQKQVAQVQAPVVQQQQQGQAVQKKTREPWIIKPTDISIKPEGNSNGGKEGKEPTKEQQDALARTGTAASLIKPATWAKPKYALRTLYRSQALAGRTLDEINSSIPGQVRIELTIPVFDKFGKDVEILPKGAVLIAVQEGIPEFGQSRLPFKLEQIELPTSEVISLKAAVGSEQGANGITGKVNRHIPSILLATGINMLVNIGAKSLAGQPGQGYYFQNPAQSAVADAGQSLQQDTKSIVDKTLRIPPTITIRAGTNVSVNLSENVTFSRSPLVVK